MADPYLGEIKLFAFNMIPRGWITCDGSLLPVSNYQALFTLYGTTYGGDGKKTFGIPDLRGRVLVGAVSPTSTSGNYHLGEQSGAETIALTPQNIPLHNHNFMVSNVAGTSTGLADASYAVVQTPTPQYLYATPTGTWITFEAQLLQNVGGGQKHDNMQPYVVMSYCVATQGVYPPRP